MYGSRLQHTIVLIATALLVISFLTYYTHNISYFSPLHALSSLSASWPLSQSLPPSTSVSSNLLGKVHDAYNTTDLLKFATKRPDGNYYPPQYTEYGDHPIPRIKAGFIVLVRNSELDAMKASMKQVEDKFNKNFNYPWIFLNNEPFTAKFEQEVKTMTNSKVRFGLIPKEHWSFPQWVSPERAAETREKMREKVPYGDSESYRHMCRYQSGFFFQHPLTLDLDFYWRVEPGIQLHCELNYDPFLFMAMNNKTYGFTIALYEFFETVTTLYQTSRDFLKTHPHYINDQASIRFLSDEPDKSIDDKWNLCHFWSNFEIGNLNFWRSKEYMEYFDYLDKSGGFFYERWGDAPVHSIAVALFLDKSRVHQFDDIGYTHHPWTHCPADVEAYQSGKCQCDPAKSFDKDGYSCLRQWWANIDAKKPLQSVRRSTLH